MARRFLRRHGSLALILTRLWWRAMCGRCQVNVGVGEFAKHGIRSGADSLDDVTAVETRYADKRGLAGAAFILSGKIMRRCGD